MEFKKLVVKVLTEQSRQEKQKELQSYSPWNRKHNHRKLDKMNRQRIMFQIKEQDKIQEKQLNEMDTGNLPEK